MSKSRGCMIIEQKPNEWVALVACDEYDYEFVQATCYGPVATEDAASDLVSKYESNPGGESIVSFANLTPEIIALIKQYPPTMPKREWW